MRWRSTRARGLLVLRIPAPGKVWGGNTHTGDTPQYAGPRNATLAFRGSEAAQLTKGERFDQQITLAWVITPEGVLPEFPLLVVHKAAGPKLGLLFNLPQDGAWGGTMVGFSDSGYNARFPPQNLPPMLAAAKPPAVPDNSLATGRTQTELCRPRR